MRKKTISLLSIVLLSSCLGGYSPDSKFYRLPPLQQVAQTYNAKPSIAVLKIGLPEYIDRPQMIMFDETSPQIEIAEFNRWGEELSAMIQRKITADLATYLPQAKVIDAKEEVQNATLNVKVEIIRMDMMKQGKVVLQANWYVLNAKGKLLATAKFMQQQNIAPNYADYAKATAELLGKMSDRIAQSIAQI